MINNEKTVRYVILSLTTGDDRKTNRNTRRTLVFLVYPPEKVRIFQISRRIPRCLPDFSPVFFSRDSLPANFWFLFADIKFPKIT